MNLPKRLPPRPKAITWFMAMPVIFGFILVVSMGVLGALGMMGGTAEGERLQIQLQTACGDQAHGVVQARIERIGLGEPQLSADPDGLRLVATMPGLPDDRSLVPALLAQPGHLQVIDGASNIVLATHTEVIDAGLQLDESGLPLTLVEFGPDAMKRLAEATEGAPDSHLRIEFDGENLGERPNTPPLVDGELRLPSGEGLTKLRMRRAADRAILLQSGPLPCPVQVGAVALAAADR